FSSYMHSMAPRPCFFMRSRARSVRYFFIRSQLTRCCQSNPAMPKFAVPMVSPELKPRGPVVDGNSSRLFPIAEDHIAASPSAIGEPAAAEGRAALTLIRCDQPGLQLLRLNTESAGAGTNIAADAVLVAISSRPVPDRL